MAESLNVNFEYLYFNAYSNKITEKGIRLYAENSWSRLKRLSFSIVLFM